MFEHEKLIGVGHRFTAEEIKKLNQDIQLRPAKINLEMDEELNYLVDAQGRPLDYMLMISRFLLMVCKGDIRKVDKMLNYIGILCCKLDIDE